jgi:TIR domain
MPGQPAAFVSYVRFNDQHDDGWVSQFCELLSAEVRVQIGEEFPIFQDRKNIAWGESWQQRIDQALDAVTLLLVIITPGFFRSSACKAEVKRFLSREHDLGRDDLILPVYYVSTPELDDPERRDADELARVLSSRQFADWRDLRFEPLTSPKARKAVAELAIRMRDTFWRSPASPSSGHRERVQQTAEQTRSADNAPAARVPAKTDQRVKGADLPAAARRAKASKGADGPLTLHPAPFELVEIAAPRLSMGQQLDELVRLTSRELSELVQRIGQYDDANNELVSFLDEAGQFLRALSDLVEDLDHYDYEETGRGPKPTQLLRHLSDSIRRARDAIDDFKVTLRGELLQRAAENEHHNYRPNKRFREDQQELRALGRAAEGELTELREVMKSVMQRLDAAGH